MRHLLTIFLVLVAAVLLIAGLRGGRSRKPPIELFPDMVRQPIQRPQFENQHFKDGRGSRLRPEGTIALGEWVNNPALNSGRVAGTTNYLEHNPLAATPELLQRGQERFNIICAACHGGQGDGNGVARRIGAMGVVASLHEQRIVLMPDGEIFNTVTLGKNLMAGYAGAINVADRWAIIAYVRALQLSKLGLMDDVPVSDRNVLK